MALAAWEAAAEPGADSPSLVTSVGPADKGRAASGKSVPLVATFSDALPFCDVDELPGVEEEAPGLSPPPPAVAVADDTAKSGDSAGKIPKELGTAGPIPEVV